MHLAPPRTLAVREWLLDHLLDHYTLYGEAAGVRSARKHIGWAVHALPGGAALRARINAVDDAATQWQLLSDWLAELADAHPQWPDAVHSAQTELEAA